MQKVLKQKKLSGKYHIKINGSKSESNRLLILKSLFPTIKIQNLSTADDTQILQNILHNDPNKVDVGHAGTAMRFLTAYYAFFSKKEKTITGSKIMQKRPIRVLVDALLSIGAKIEYLQEEGYPPLKVYPSYIHSNSIQLQANISSQYISALMLCAPKVKDGIEINFTTTPTSIPYIKMTAKLLKKLGIKIVYTNRHIKIYPTEEVIHKPITVESDWSSASYYYSLIALSPDLSLKLSNFKEKSLQGDSHVSKIYSQLGVKTIFEHNTITLINNNIQKPKYFTKNLNNCPDLAQTVAITCLGLGIKSRLTGLQTLKIKETNRLQALQNEIQKLGAIVNIDEESIEIHPSKKITPNQNISTYNDHRMAMAFTPLFTLTDINIDDMEVVSKSYPKFWEDIDVLIN